MLLSYNSVVNGLSIGLSIGLGKTLSIVRDINGVALEISVLDAFDGDELTYNLVLLKLSGFLELDRSGLELRRTRVMLLCCHTCGARCHHINRRDCHDADSKHDDFVDVLLHNVLVLKGT